METIGDIAKTIRSVAPTGKAHKGTPFITEGMTPRNTPTKTGLVEITPEQALAIRVERVGFNGEVTGYQRPITNMTHVRRIAAAISKGRAVEPVTLGLDGGNLYAVDGHHRILAHVLARKPLRAVVDPMTYKQRAERFAAQRYRSNLTADNLVLASSDKIANYIKAAISHPDHPWHPLVGMTGNNKHISPNLAYECVGRYCAGIIGGGGSLVMRMPSERIMQLDLDQSSELAKMFLSVGTKLTNPYAYRPATARAFTDVAVLAIIRAERGRTQLIERWCRHMPGFDWQAYGWATRTADMRPALIAHWNKRLAAAQKISA
jgi:hypothetical protein